MAISSLSEFHENFIPIVPFNIVFDARRIEREFE